MPSETAGDEIATQNPQKSEASQRKGVIVLTMLMQVLHLVDDGAELVRVYARHIILLICAHTQKQPQNQTQPNGDQEPMPRVPRPPYH
jgi:hypothetical protein